MQPDEQQPQETPQASSSQYQQVASDVQAVNQSAETPNSADDTPQTPLVESADTDSSEPIHWQETEYVHREKTQIWFVVFGISVLALILIAVFIIKSLTFAILVPVMAAALLVYTRRPPRLFDYTLSRQGLHINDQLYPFSEFKSFALVHGIDHYSIMFIPTKRFKPAVSANFPEEIGEALVDMLAARLPMQQMQPDVFDRIIRKLRI